MENKGMKIEDLARITQKGFEETAKKTDLDGLEKEVREFRGEVNERLDRLERIIFSEYKNRIEKLEDRVNGLEVDYRELLSLKNK